MLRRLAMSAVLCTTSLSAGCGGLEAGKGRVVDSETGLPLAGAAVTLDCQTGAGWHGSRTVRVVTSVTDAKGEYRFTRADVSGCDRGSMWAEKAGYVSLSGGKESIWHTADNHLFELVPEAEATMRRMKYWLRATQMSTLPSWPAEKQYAYVYFFFVNSRNIAETPREKAFVRESYCARLAELLGRLSAEERARLASEKEFVRTGAKPGWQTVDTAEVARTCEAAAG